MDKIAYLVYGIAIAWAAAVIYFFYSVKKSVSYDQVVADNVDLGFIVPDYMAADMPMAEAAALAKWADEQTMTELRRRGWI